LPDPSGTRQLQGRRDAEIMKHDYYTLSVWQVKPGMEDEFRAAWRDLAKAFSELSDPPISITLLQNTDDPHLFYSFSPWASMDAVHAMRRNSDARKEIRRVTGLCTEFRMDNFHARDEIDNG
jgi:heme-degrading monooxygenase HmoA